MNMGLSDIKISKDQTAIILIIACGFVLMSFFKIKYSFGFMNMDEFLWMYRSRFFIDRIMDLDFGRLIQSSQPGIMVMWFSGPFMKLLDFDFQKIVGLISSLNDSGGYNVINDPKGNYYAGYETISFLFNIPIVILMLSFIVISNYLLRKIGFERRAAYLSLLIISTTPYYVFFTTPTDKLAGIFSAIGLLSLIVHSKGKGGRKFLIASGIAVSWAVITKLSTLILVPFSLFILFVYQVDGVAVHNFGIFKKKALSVAGDYLSWFIVFTVTSVIFFPTIIANPSAVLKLFSGEKSPGSFLTNDENLSVLGLIEKYLNDPFALSFNFFILVVFFVFLFLIVRRFEYKIDIRKDILCMYLYIFSFFIFIVLFGKTYSFRYLVPILIFFQIISGAGIYEISKILGRRSKLYSRDEIFVWEVIFVLVSQALLIHYSEIVQIK